MNSNPKIAEHNFYQLLQSQDAMTLEVDVNQIIWPGNTSSKPQGYMIPTKLKVQKKTGRLGVL